MENPEFLEALPRRDREGNVIAGHLEQREWHLQAQNGQTFIDRLAGLAGDLANGERRADIQQFIQRVRTMTLRQNDLSD
ncbi:MAG: hypothetical protein F6J86_42705 [Symploca sp. SIO1B1]|nr:hypothetical protein [Symploca sp. SIO1B1]